MTDEVNNERILRKGIFNDNIRYYLGSSEKVEVNASMKNSYWETKIIYLAY
ncbi:hypothetical protein KK421_00390 [Clostridioides difficile]|nr:hypothetical protein [Clostridioides difficile]